MADFYPVLARAVSQLPVDAPQARRDLYDHARGILIAQLRNRDPHVSVPEMMREQAALESAIRRLEAETLLVPHRFSTQPNAQRLPANPGGEPGNSSQGTIDHNDLDAVFRDSKVAARSNLELRSTAASTVDTRSRSNPTQPSQSATNRKNFSVDLNLENSRQTAGEQFSTEIDNSDFDEFIATSQLNTAAEISVDPLVDRIAPAIVIANDGEALGNPSEIIRSPHGKTWDRDREDSFSILAAVTPSTAVDTGGVEWMIQRPEPSQALGTSVNPLADRTRPRTSEPTQELHIPNKSSYPTRDEDIREWESDRRAVLVPRNEGQARGGNKDRDTFQNLHTGLAPDELLDPVADRLKTRLALNKLAGPAESSHESRGASHAVPQRGRGTPDPIQRRPRISSQENVHSTRAQAVVNTPDEPGSFGLALISLALFVAILVFVAVICVPLLMIHFPRLLWFAQHLFDSPKALATIIITSSLLLLLFVPIFRKRRKKSALGLLWRSMRLTTPSA